ncbi:MAG: LytTR family DNA-binding domain-containing protein [Bacteroidota bacterium]
MRCIIVDDEQMSRVHLAHLCKKIDAINVVGVFNDAMSAYRFLSEEQVDLVFLDIEMPDFSGIDLVRQLHNPPAIVFITSKQDYAVKTFDFIETVIDYLLKPVSLARLLKAVERYQNYQIRKESRESGIAVSVAMASTTSSKNQHHHKDNRHLFVKTERKLVRIDLDDLLYVETVGDYSIFKTVDQQYTVHATLKSIDERLTSPNFLKVHRSFIVNLDKIKDIEDNNLLIDHKIIPISRTHRSQLLERIMPL